LQKALGKDKVVLPTDKSTKEEWNAFWRKIGAPEKAEDYDVSDDELPEQIRASQVTKDNFRKSMLEAGVPKKHFEAAWKFYKENAVSSMNQQVESLKNMRGDSEAKLRSEWGAAYEGKVEGAPKVIDTFFKDKGVRPEFNVLANDIGFIKAMADIAEKIGEDVIAGKPRVSMTPNEAQTELNTMLMDRKHPFHNELHPEHDAAVDKFADLQRLIEAGNS
jgi:hypothetical protein